MTGVKKTRVRVCGERHRSGARGAEGEEEEGEGKEEGERRRTQSRRCEQKKLETSVRRKVCVTDQAETEGGGVDRGTGEKEKR